MLETLVGNAQFKASLAAALKAGRLSHSVLLCGEEGLGANYAARCLAADYLYPQGGDGARQVMAGQSAEVLLVEGEGASGNIRVDRIRAVRQAVYSTALSAAGRVVLIRGAHRLGGARGEAANALLKVLEEPPEGVLFILTAPGEAVVLPTIRSRCCIYALAPVSAAACSDYLKQNAPAAKNAAELCAVFGGKLGSVLRCATQKPAAARYETAKALAAAVAAQDEYTLLKLLAKAEKDRAEARALLALLRQICAAALPGGGLLPAAAAAGCIALLSRADARLAGNVSPKLVLTVLAADLAAA